MSPEQAYRQLSAELRLLVERAGAENAFVFDAWAVLWCSAALTFGEDQERLYGQVIAVLESLQPPLQRGSKVDATFPHEITPMYCGSFGATYVLGLWTTKATNEFVLRRAVRAALPQIEAMVISFPPPDGSGTSSGAQHGAG